MRVYQVMYLVFFLVAMSGFGCGARQREKKPGPEPDKAVDRASATVVRGLRVSVCSLKCEQGVLDGVFQLEFLQRHREWYGGGDTWALDHAWGAIQILWYDSSGREMAPKVVEDFLYELDFLLGKTKKQHVTFSLPVPSEARFVSVQYGRSECITKKVPIP
jgi:hypothetical protein